MGPSIAGYVRLLDKISKDDIPLVGGKGANLGEMHKAGFAVPEAFVVTTKAYKAFLRANQTRGKIESLLGAIDVDNGAELEAKAAAVRKMIESSPIPGEVAGEVAEGFEALQGSASTGPTSFAVRSSATTEDLKEASFAGQQSSFMNVRTKESLFTAIRRCWASAFTPRAIFYRAKKGFGATAPLTAVVVQRQVFSEKSGVGFCVHPVSGDKGVIVIEGSWGQGEEIVSGRVTPDTFVIEKEGGKLVERNVADKKRMKIMRVGSEGLEEIRVPRMLRQIPSLSEDELKQLWSLARRCESYFAYPQDFEWAIQDGKVFLLQTRAVTAFGGGVKPSKDARKPEVRGLAASPGMGIGPVKLVAKVEELHKVKKGDILVTRMTTPDFVPAMMKTAAIVTDEGGMTSHAAIVSRELGVPCVVGTGNGTRILKDRAKVTVDGSNGLVFLGGASRPARSDSGEDLGDADKLVTKTKVYMNLGVPEKISDYIHLPFDGIGLMRVEFLIASYIREHPLHVLDSGREDFFIRRLADGMAKVARPVAPRPVVVRFSDFKTNEYRALKGGRRYEEVEPNPIIGWRGVARYISPEFERAFRMELKAMKMVRDDLKLKNVWAMLPFVRTTWEVKRCLNIIEEEGLVRDGSFKLWLMAEVPSTVFLAEEFAELCDGFSIGSNDLTQLILGLDRDSGRLGKLGYFDERDVAVKEAIRMLIEGAHKKGKTVSICGQAPSVYPDFAKYLIGLGIDSVSVNPDVVSKTRRIVHQLENDATAAPRVP